MDIRQRDISGAGDISGILEHGVIEVWRADTALQRDFILSRLSLLDSNEKERYVSFRREEDRLCFAGGRIFTKILAGRYLSKETEEINVISEKYMKPFIECGGKLKYNISHSGGYILLAFTYGSEVGVDIEKKDDSFDVMSLINVLHPVERTAVLENGNVDTFYTIWTAKEAYVKAIGKGFSISPNSFYINKEGFAVRGCLISKDHKVVRIDAGSSFFGALCFGIINYGIHI